MAQTSAARQDLYYLNSDLASKFINDISITYSREASVPYA